MITETQFNHLREELVSQMNQAEEGEISILDAVIHMRKQRAFYEEMLKHIKSFEDENRDSIQEEAEMYENTYKGATFEFRSGGKTFDYSKIDEVAEAEEKVKELKDKYKLAFENSQKGLLAISEDGEELQLPIPKYRKSSLIIKLPK